MTHQPEPRAPLTEATVAVDGSEHETLSRAAAED